MCKFIIIIFVHNRSHVGGDVTMQKISAVIMHGCVSCGPHASMVVRRGDHWVTPEVPEMLRVPRVPKVPSGGDTVHQKWPMRRSAFS